MSNNTPWLRGLGFRHWEYLDARNCEDYYCGLFFSSVIRDTVTRNTGLKDIDGKLIYEGDAVSYNRSVIIGEEDYIIGVVFFDRCCFLVKFNNESVIPLWNYHFNGDKSYLKIIGNIYEGEYKETNYVEKAIEEDALKRLKYEAIKREMIELGLIRE